MHSVRKRTPNPFPRVRQQRRALGLPLPAEGAEECVPRRAGWRWRRRAVDALRVEEEYITSVQAAGAPHAASAPRAGRRRSAESDPSGTLYIFDNNKYYRISQSATLLHSAPISRSARDVPRKSSFRPSPLCAQVPSSGVPTLGCFVRSAPRRDLHTWRS